jgi:aromatic ring hydroxylase
MPARAGRDFLRELKDDREIWVGSERVRDVAAHPAFAGAARSLAALFDLQHEAAAVCLMPDSETGEPINVSHLIPRSRGDLERRHACLERLAEFSVGIMGHPGLSQRDPGGLRGPRRRVGGPRQRARSGAPSRLPEGGGAA